MSAYSRTPLWIIATLFVFPTTVIAGMPKVLLTITDAARPRLETISFFLVGFLVSAAAIMLLWNYLRKDWTFLPRLNFWRALVVVTLWGLLFVLVLTMISGARELMTPGAWERQGSTYRLVVSPITDIGDHGSLEERRRLRLERIWNALSEYARQRGGQFPLTANAISGELWTLPDMNDMSYRYVGDRRTDSPGWYILVHEPEIYGDERYVLFTNGAIRKMSSETIATALEEHKQ